MPTETLLNKKKSPNRRDSSIDSYSQADEDIGYEPSYNWEQISPKRKPHGTTVLVSSIEDSANIYATGQSLFSIFYLLLIHQEPTEPLSYYLSKISKLPNIEAIIYERKGDFYFFETILSKRDIETNHKIYDIEMEMFINFDCNTFEFAVTSLDDDLEIDSLIANRNVIFLKDIIYAQSK